MVLFPQSFEDYQLTDGKIRLDHFLEGIGDVLPGHLHGLYQVGEAFMSADTNVMFRSILFSKNWNLSYFTYSLLSTEEFKV